MNSKLKKMLPALTLSLVAFTSAVSAVDDMQMRNLENRVNALEQRKGGSGMINPPARPVVKDGIDLWFQGEALLFHATEDGMDYAINSSSASLPIGTVRHANYEWDWGFRVGVGYNLPHDGWDIMANWTWFHSSKHHKLAAGDKNPIPTRVASFDVSGNTVASNIETKQRLHLNLVDVEMGREFFVSKWLTVRPFAGARGAWIKRNFEVEYTSAGPVVTEVEFHDRYRAVGLRSGFDTQWGLGSGCSIYGQVAFSLLCGKHHFNSEEENDVTLEEKTRDRWQMVRAMTDLGIGFRWDRLIYDDNYRIRLQVGWEEHLFFGFNRDIDFVDHVSVGKFTSNRGDLAISGVSFQARFDF